MHRPPTHVCPFVLPIVLPVVLLAALLATARAQIESASPSTSPSLSSSASPSPTPSHTPSSTPSPFQQPTDADPIPNVPWASSAQFALDHSVSDEFDGNSLDLRKWDEHGFRNPVTQCPTWNGPESTAEDPTLSTLFPAVDHPTKPNKKIRLYRLRDGKFQMRVVKKKLKFFEAREYYCNATTFRCNHDDSIPCFSTDFFGEPILDKTTGDYVSVNHDKCKKSPFCIPHYKYIRGREERIYSKFASVHLSGKHYFRYGFIETKVRLANSSAVFAVWMHGRETTGPGFCRYRKVEGFKLGVRRECPSYVKSDRWQEIDLVESMDSTIHGKRFIPNIHVFKASKGEFTSADSVDDGSGNMGGGPIILDRGNFNTYRNLFNDVPIDQRKTNDYHLGAGGIADLNQSWSEREHVVGVYWSAGEIRFYLDGVEIERMRNTIVHQPMVLDLSCKINAGWSMQTPTGKELKRWGSVDYVRLWSVSTVDGVEPPSTLPLSERMADKFKDLYGNKMYGVYNRWPHKDSVTLEAVPPTERNVKNPASSGQEGVVEAEFLSGHPSEIGRYATFRPVPGAGGTSSARMLLANSTEPAMRKNSKSRTKRVPVHRSGTMRPAGGKAQTVEKIQTVIPSEFEVNDAYSNPMRSAIVNRLNGEPTAEIIENGAATAFDLGDPDTCWSGTCSKDGNGEGIGQY